MPSAEVITGFPTPALPDSAITESVLCSHCGLICPAGAPWVTAGLHFCCAGCQTVHELLTSHGLEQFYEIGQQSGLRIPRPSEVGTHAFLDEPSVREALLEFEGESAARVTFRVPAIHCVACIWLLENLFRLHEGIGRTQVNFPRREVSILFDPGKVQLSEVAGLLASLGYAPDLNYADLEVSRAYFGNRRLWSQMAVAGFAFGNIMLFSLPGYFGMDAFGGPGFSRLFGWVSLALALPVVVFSAGDYWRSAFHSLRQRRLALEVPIALGLAALFGQSLREVLTQTGPGYCDSLTGLVFFLLIGRWFQQKTYDRLSFERDYKSFFPLAVCRVRDGRELRVPLSAVAVGDVLRVRHGELIPADAELVQGEGHIDYSFVTGEADPVDRRAGDRLYAGGRQSGTTLEIRLLKAVSQSYLTSLWNQEESGTATRPTLRTLTGRFSPWFTLSVVALALGAGSYWFTVSPARGLLAFTAVLIVACPCALALAAPFALGTFQRLLGRHGVYLKNAEVLESLAAVDSVVFDKTGTLTQSGSAQATWMGPPLDKRESAWVAALTCSSTHPHSRSVSRAVELFVDPTKRLAGFREHPGQGLEGTVEGHAILMGSATWMRSRGVRMEEMETGSGSRVHVAIDGTYRGGFQIRNAPRDRVASMIGALRDRLDLALLSGDRDLEAPLYREWFGSAAELRFEQTPGEKRDFVRHWQHAGRRVLMIGDGLNDAGALKSSDVGIAVVEEAGSFSPASDVILDASLVPGLDALLACARSATRVVRVCLGVSVIYNLAGLSFAASGRLSPVVCAILMPVSSITVVGLAAGLGTWLATRHGFGPTESGRGTE